MRRRPSVKQVLVGYLMNCLRALSLHFDDNAVVVDSGNYNAARIWKLYGTKVGKGDNLPERPHRIARILYSPTRIEAVPLPWLQYLAAQSPTEPTTPSRPSYGGNGQQFDLERWLAQHQIAVRFRGSWNGGQKWVLERCPWNAEHTDKSAYIVRFSSGAIAVGCHHNSCQGRGWSELRDAVEPGYRVRFTSANTVARRANLNLYRRVQ
jgi:hypothetical protein